MLKNKEIDKINHFKYFGNVIKNDGKSTMEIRSRTS